jgi:hypothetical protein
MTGSERLLFIILLSHYNNVLTKMRSAIESKKPTLESQGSVGAGISSRKGGSSRYTACS